MPKIAGTSVDIAFIEKPRGGHAPIYYAAGEGSLALASLNAGDSGLYVGGGGINQGFGAILSRTQKAAEYQKRHIALLRCGRKHGSFQALRR